MAGIEISPEEFEQWKQEKAWIERLEKANGRYIIAESNHAKCKRELTKATQERDLAAKEVSQIIAERSKAPDPQMRLPFGDKDPMADAGGEAAKQPIEVIGYTQAVKDKLQSLGFNLVGDIEDLILGRHPGYPLGPDQLKLPKQEAKQVVSQYQRYKGTPVVSDDSGEASEADHDAGDKGDSAEQGSATTEVAGSAPVISGQNALPKGRKRRSKLTKAKIVRMEEGWPPEFQVGMIVTGELKNEGFLINDPIWLFAKDAIEICDDSEPETQSDQSAELNAPEIATADA